MRLAAQDSDVSRIFQDVRKFLLRFIDGLMWQLHYLQGGIKSKVVMDSIELHNHLLSQYEKILIYVIKLKISGKESSIMESNKCEK